MTPQPQLIADSQKFQEAIKPREAWRALGFADWTECIKAMVEEYSLSERYIWMMHSANKTESLLNHGSVGEIPERQLRPLTALPPEQISLFRGRRYNIVGDGQNVHQLNHRHPVRRQRENHPAISAHLLTKTGEQEKKASKGTPASTSGGSLEGFQFAQVDRDLPVEPARPPHKGFSKAQ